MHVWYIKWPNKYDRGTNKTSLHYKQNRPRFIQNISKLLKNKIFKLSEYQDVRTIHSAIKSHANKFVEMTSPFHLNYFPELLR